MNAILKAYFQVLNAKAQTAGSSFEKNALSKADHQVKKMGEMINAFFKSLPS